ncbi:unnamed protein product [Bursaphelenchus okinawaensis]|uniref:Uncharacterized protein n=1 Tax=Bursaphelenchus okinawaensis TaxID=465554 RepID=A0A811K8N4_9BILA|nr:unnamed protein product [Bursaphelenchus okinawaensis]CAG9095107.1 unnamed protein product [Bursaphelenchus okinawaensis]
MFCNHISAEKKHLAILRNDHVVHDLMKTVVVHPDLKYFVGTKADVYQCKADERCCPDKEKFFYYDDAGLQGPVNSSLWLRFQPDNLEGSVPEQIVTLEPAWRTYQGPVNLLGFNDVNGQQQEIPLLCEYRDKYKCPEGFVFNDGVCTGILECGATGDECESKCTQMGNSFGGKAMLPSIHNDNYNWFLATQYRKVIMSGKENNFKNGKLFSQYWPIMIGMKHIHGQWVNLDQTPSDYFRWWSLENKEVKLFTNPDKGYKRVFLMVRVNGDDGISTFGYWANNYHDKDKIPFVGCQVKPKKLF